MAESVEIPCVQCGQPWTPGAGEDPRFFPCPRCAPPDGSGRFSTDELAILVVERVIGEGRTRAENLLRALDIYRAEIDAGRVGNALTRVAPELNQWQHTKVAAMAQAAADALSFTRASGRSAETVIHDHGPIIAYGLSLATSVPGLENEERRQQAFAAVKALGKVMK